MPNPNTLYANTFVDALVASGLRRVCVAPGSRHTPLVLALARHESEIELSSHLDERSAAFFALGQALASGAPVALVCTSGSAAANFFPAIIEAKQSRIPLIVLTADRPHELRGSGANQTIDQLKLFGETVESFVDAPLPESTPSALALRQLRTLAARAFETAAMGGVAHINMPFRKPFEPGADDAPIQAIHRAAPTRFLSGEAGDTALSALLRRLDLGPRGLIYCGHGACRTPEERAAMTPWLAGLARATGYPVLAEASSNLRFGNRELKPIRAYESFITAADFAPVDAVIRFGAPPLSNAKKDFLAANLPRHHITCGRAYADDSHSATHHVQFDPAAVDAAEWEGARADDRWARKLRDMDAAARAAVASEIETGAYFDGAVLHDIVDLTPGIGALFAGSSLPIRHLDQFGLRADASPLVYANRGASGIDGNVSTALGIGAARAGKPMVAVLGDITLYHDMNGLLAIARCGAPATIVLLNNGGGGIFQRLPVRDFEPHFSRFFTTPHGLDFSLVAALYGLDYIRADGRACFRRAFRAAVSGGGSTIIEVRTDALADLRRRAEIMAAVERKVSKSK